MSLLRPYGISLKFSFISYNEGIVLKFTVTERLGLSGKSTKESESQSVKFTPQVTDWVNVYWTYNGEELTSFN